MILQNEFMTVEIADHGAELMRICDRRSDRELLWNGDPAYWKRRSPILFPNVGKTFGNVMRIEGAEYPTSQHGFARDMAFEMESFDGENSSVWYLLKSNAETLARYPFDFELRIHYELNGMNLHVSWHVRNLSNCNMPFTIGGHPAFALDGSKEDYQLYFPDREELRYLLLNPASGTAIADRSYTIALENGCLPLTEELFAHDALILDGGQVESVYLCDRNKRVFVSMSCPGFPNYGIWSVQGAKFVCLEPWMGRCDDCGYNGEFADKQNINILAPGEEFSASYSIRLPACQR